MNKESNVYTIIFAIIMVVVVGGLLAFIASSLKPAQQANVKNEKIQNILTAIDPSFDPAELAKLNRKELTELFKKHVKKRVILDYDGKVVSEKTSDDEIVAKDMTDAFNLNPRSFYAKISKIKKEAGEDDAKLRDEMLKNEIYSPMFVCENMGQTVYVANFSGKGLWDDIWGYVGIKPSRQINAAVFDHKAETPGLGSKITEEKFKDQYIGKTMATESDTYKPIKVLKPGKELDQYSVEGISGATFTGVGVDEMMGRALSATHAYMKENVPVAEDTYSGEPVEYGLALKEENVNGTWNDANGTVVTFSSGDYTIGDSTGKNVIYVDSSMLVIQEAGKEFPSTYNK